MQNPTKQYPNKYRKGLIRSRRDFGKLLLKHSLTGTAVEIGVHQGWFAKHFLCQWPGLYIGIDAWAEDIEGYGTDQTTRLPAYDEGAGRHSHNRRTVDMEIAARELEEFGPRAVLIRAMSDVAADLLPFQIDFVYIDGNHESEYVQRDIDLWSPKVKKGGIIAGHDLYSLSGTVCERVEPVIRSNFKTVYVVPDRGAWSWYVIKE